MATKYLFAFYLILLCNTKSIAQHFFYNKDTKTYTTESYMDSLIANLNNSISEGYPYILKKETRNDSIITTWITWPFARQLQQSQQNIIVSTLQRNTINDLFKKRLPKNYLKGKTIILNLWADFCLPCIEEIPLLNKVKDNFIADTNIVFVAACGDAIGKCKLYAKDYNFVHMQGSAANLLHNKVKLSYYPTTLIINSKGIITHYLRQSADKKRYPDLETDSYYLTLMQTINSLKKVK